MDRYECIKSKTQGEARELVCQMFPQRANLYAVLDYAVCFGFYDKDHYYLGLEGQKAPMLLDWKYLIELRIFDREKELLLVSTEDGFTGRIRRDVSSELIEEKDREYVIEEHQKLWGKRKMDRKEELPGWSLLASQRGTKIQIPIDLQQEVEAAILVRRYMRIPNVENKEELVFEKDIRMVDFCPWKGEGE